MGAKSKSIAPTRKLGTTQRTKDGLGVRESGRRRRSGACQSSTVLIMLLLLVNSVSEM